MRDVRLVRHAQPDGKSSLPHAPDNVHAGKLPEENAQHRELVFQLTKIATQNTWCLRRW
jgi:hypothetical protein